MGTIAQGYTLITGGAGFIGSNVADALLSDGDRVVVADNLSRPGVVRNAQWLTRRHGERVRIEQADVREAPVMDRLVAGARAVYHFAAQVAVTTSLDDPAADFETNLRGTFNVLEAARRRADPPPVLFTSTNKVYGALEDVRVERQGDRYVLPDAPDGIPESTPLDFHSPYGCSKGAADQYVRDYARIFDVPSVVFRLSCVYGRRQWGTEDQGWVAHFGRALLRDEVITIYGDGHQVRDILWIDDLVAAMRRALERMDRTAGQVYNVGGGPENAVSVREAVDRIAGVLPARPRVVMSDWRPGDQRVYVTDTRRARRDLDWRPGTSVEQGVERLMAWLQEAERAPAARRGLSRYARGTGASAAAAAGT